jgi:uncharacterized membrane protein YeaQ/YmgE (transglycosylase-associated protein family)
MDLLMIAALGGFVGWLAGILVRTSAPVGTFTNVIVGMAGAFFSIAVADLLTVRPSGRLGSLGLAVVGALLLTAALRGLGVFDRLAAAR